MGIDNPDVKLVIQWDLPISFDSMIQRMGRAGRKGGYSYFVLFSPKWTMVKDEEEITNRSNKTTSSAQLSNDNRPKALVKASPLSLVTNAIADTSDAESVAESEAAESEAAEFDDDQDDLIAAFLATEADEQQIQKKKDKKANQSDAAKRAKLPDEIFDYIHVAQYRRLFSLAWYDDLTYADQEQIDGSITKKALPTACCNGPSCKSVEPEFLHREPFIQSKVIKHTESDREWMACRTAALKKWRKATADRVWLEQGVDSDEELPDTLIMDDNCLIALAKNGEVLQDKTSLIQFLKPWYGMERYTDELLACIQQNSSCSATPDLPSKSERKAILTAARNSKKLKGMDDPLLAEEARMIALRDSWLVENGKANAATKARLKKAAEAKKKAQEKLDQAKEKAKSKEQGLGMRKLAIANRRAEFGTFKALLSDPPTGNDLPPSASSHTAPPTASPLPISAAERARAARLEKKKALAKASAQKLGHSTGKAKEAAKRKRTPTPPPVPMELIRPGSKRRVRVTSIAAETTPSRRMRRAEADDG